MSTNTPVFGLFAYDPETDGNLPFNINQALNNNWDKIDSLVLPSTAAAAPYNPSGTYEVGDFCTYNGTLQKCNTPIPSGEPWNADHWTNVTLTQLLYPLGGATTPQAALAALGAMAADATGADIPVSSSDQTPISASLSNKIGVPIQIPAHADLNDYTTAGLYYAGADDIVATISNCPTTHAFSLLVEIGANAEPVQTLKTWNDGNAYKTTVFVRSGYPEWGDVWQKYVFAISPQVDPLTLYPGWTAWRACQFFKTQENVVVVSFQVKTESPKSGEINIASLPVGFRPKIVSGENGAIGADGSCTVDGKYAGADIVVYQDGRITGYNAVGAAQYYTGHIVFEAET